MSELLEKLKKYGADVEGAMRRFVDDDALYETCFKIFLEDEAFQKLGQALMARDYKQAFEHAHTLKGVVGNMGLTPIYQLICNMVEALRQNEYSGLQEAYTQIMAQLDRLKKL